MQEYVMYNDDVPVARFSFAQGLIHSFEPSKPELLPMQLRTATTDGFSAWLRDRAIDLNTFQHRQLMSQLLGSRDKSAIAIMTNMFSISDTFTCFEEGRFVKRELLCAPDDQNAVSDMILVSSDTSLRTGRFATPNASTDGSFTKTWKYEDSAWWLYKLQSTEATKSECEISKALLRCGWDAAEYQYVSHFTKRIKSKNFVDPHEFFEPYESFRFMFQDKSDDEEIIYRNIASLGSAFEEAWRRILLADALFLNTDRHMRNFGVIRSAITGDVLRLAPNFDNNQAYLANPGGHYTDSMLRIHMETYGEKKLLAELVDVCREASYLQEAVIAAEKYL